MSTFKSKEFIYVGHGGVPTRNINATNVPIDVDTNVKHGSHDFDIRDSRIEQIVFREKNKESTKKSKREEIREEIQKEIRGEIQKETREKNSNSVASWISRWVIPDTSYCVLKEKLQHVYRYVTLPKATQLRRDHDLPMEKYFVKLQLNQSNKSIEMNEIFNCVNSKKALRILIEGNPGFGKSTLACKLAFDWARNEKYIEHFKLVFFFSLNQIQQISEAIEAVGKRCNCRDISHIVNNHQQDTLFVFDALNETSCNERAEIIEILYKQKYSEVTVVAFCKTNSFTLSQDECMQVFGLPTLSNNYHNKQINILGVQSVETKRQFLEKFFPESTVHDIIEHFLPHLKLLDSPLLLMALPAIMANKERLPTKTEFLRESFNCILRHNRRDNDIDVFSLEDEGEASDIQRVIREFGMLAVRNIVHRESKIRSNGVTRTMYEYGFLMKHKDVTFLRTEIYYEALELSIMEFAAAFTMWMDFKLNKSEFVQFVPFHLEPIANHFIETEGKLLALPFLANLMQSDFYCMLTEISSCDAQFALRYDLIIKLLSRNVE